MPTRTSLASLAALRALLALALAALFAAEARAARFTVCTFSFNSPDELAVFRARLPPADFDVVDLTPALLPTQTAHAARAEREGSRAPDSPWLLELCRPALRCDVVVHSAEFAGRFFGAYGASLSLQDMEEASCQPRCAGLFSTPREVFLLACNTLATKDQDSRTPREYLEVLLDHGFDRSAAERAVEMRYGPLGPSFRESLRRAFAGVPRIYGFSSVAPHGEYSAPRLEHYFRATGDYAAWLALAGRSETPNRELLAAFAGTGLVQVPGLRPSDPGAADRDRICALYDEGRSLPERMRIVQQLMAREDFLSFVPTMEVFFNRHPAQLLQGEAREVFLAIQACEDARRRVLELVRELGVSTSKLELAHLAFHLEWMTADEFRALAVDSAKQLLAQPLTSEAVDITCEISKHEPIGDEIVLDDLPDTTFRVPEGLRMVDCLEPADPRVSERLLAALHDPDETVRLWAAYALSHRMPLGEATMVQLASHLRAEPAELRERLAWMFRMQSPLSDPVRRAVARHDPRLAEQLAGLEKSSQAGGARPRGRRGREP